MLCPSRRRRNFHKSFSTSTAIRGAASVYEGAGEALARKNTKNIAATSASSHGSSFKSTRREKNNGNSNNSDNTNDRYEKFVNDIISFLNNDNISYECLSDGTITKCTRSRAKK